MKIFLATILKYTINKVEYEYSLLTDIDPVLTIDQYRLLTTTEVEQRTAMLEKKIGVCALYERINEPWEEEKFPVLGWNQDTGLVFNNDILLLVN